MTKPVRDKAEIALEYPDKFYVGTFEKSSRFEAHLDPTGFALVLERPGAEDVRKSIHMHISFGLFAGILGELAATVGQIPKDDILHHEQLTEAVAQLHQALAKNPERGAIPFQHSIAGGEEHGRTIPLADVSFSLGVRAEPQNPNM